jgi:PAS domain S-box-containing protein
MSEAREPDARRDGAASCGGPPTDAAEIDDCLLAATRAEAEGRFADASTAFDRAVRAGERLDGARQAAQAAEQAGRFHLRRGLRLSGARLLARAARAYRRCGAADEADLLDAQIEDIEPARATPPPRTAPGFAHDRRAVLAAAKALADETDVDWLLARIAETALRLCEASSACLLLHEAGLGWVRAVTADDASTRLSFGDRLDDDTTDSLQARALRHAVGCDMPELVDDLCRDPRFTNEPVPSARAPTSLMVMPIAPAAGPARAVLVLSRRLARGHFRRRHVHVLELMAGQFHVSIEHAATIRRLERRVFETTREWQRTAMQLQLRHRALDALTQGVMIVDQRDGISAQVRYVNRQFTHDSGYTLADMQRLGPAALHGHDVEQPGLATLMRAVHGESACHVLLRNYRKDGAPFWSETSVAPVEPGVQVGLHSDVTARIESERLRRLNDERLRSVFDHSPDGFVVLDAQRCVSQVNAAFEAFTGLSQATLLGLEEDRFESRLAALCQPERPGQPPDLLRLNGKPSTVLWRRVRHATGGGSETVMFFRDVTHDGESDRLKNEFLTTAAHELRTPLTSVFGYAELLLARPKQPVADRNDMIEVVHRQSQVLTRLIDEVLELAHLEAGGRHVLDLRLQPLQPLVMQAAREASGSSRLGGLDVRLPLDPIWMQLDAQRIVRALVHALSNALRFSGQAPVVVSLCQPTDAGRLGISVRDSGSGMSAVQLSRLFERFFRTDGSDPSHGTGLGATLMKAIVELHGGQVTATSEPGVGTEVIFWLDRPAGLRASSEPCR